MLHEITEQEFTEEFLSVIYDNKIKDLNSKFDMILQKVNHIKLPESTTKDVINQLNEGLKYIGIDSNETDINKIIQKIRTIKIAKGNAQSSNVEKGITFTNSSGSLLTGVLDNKGDLNITPSINQQKFNKAIYNSISIKGATSDIIKSFSNDQIIKVVKDKLNNDEIKKLAEDKLDKTQITQVVKDKLNNDEIKKLAEDKLNKEQITQLAKDKLSDDDIVDIAKSKRKLYDKNDYIEPAMGYNSKKVMSNYNEYMEARFIDNGIVYFDNNDTVKLDITGKELKRLKNIKVRYVSKNIGYFVTPDNKVQFYDDNLNITKQSVISNSCFKDHSVEGVTNDFCVVLRKTDNSGRDDTLKYSYILTDINGSTLYESSKVDYTAYSRYTNQRGECVRFKNDYITGELYLCDANTSDGVSYRKVTKDTKNWGKHSGSEFPSYNYEIVDGYVYVTYRNLADHYPYDELYVERIGGSRISLNTDMASEFQSQDKDSKGCYRSYNSTHIITRSNGCFYMIYLKYNRIYKDNNIYGNMYLVSRWIPTFNKFIHFYNNKLLLSNSSNELYYLDFGFTIS